MDSKEENADILTKADVQQALKQWYGHSDAAGPMTEQYLFRRAQRMGYTNPRQAINQVLREAIDTLRDTQDDSAQLLQHRYMDDMPMLQVGNKLNVAESTAYAMQSKAIQQLTETLNEMERTASTEQKVTLERRLPVASYVKLFGVEEQAEGLLTRLHASEPPWLIAIEGIGGIGKTSLADTLLRRIIETGWYDEVGWVSAQQRQLYLGGALRDMEEPALSAEALIEKLLRQLLPDTPIPAGYSSEKMLAMLQSRLKETPHLIVIDNLETVSDVEILLPTLGKLVNPTKFLFTSRKRTYIQPNIYHVQVPELSELHALQLIRHEANLSNLPELAEGSDADLRPIIKTVGGNPLALRLVVGQTHIYSLDTILQDLAAAHSKATENLYTFIYQQAWDSLDELSRRVFLIMPLGNPHGDDINFLADVGQFGVEEVRAALNKLVTRNLVDARGGLNERRYSIHALTRTFLQEQVAKWV